MFLEISEPGTGKTERLVEAVIAWLDEHPENRAAIISPKFLDGNFVVHFFEPKYFPRLLTSKRMTNFGPALLEPGNLRFFVDDLVDIDPEYLVLVKDGYYATAPGDHRFLRKLLEESNLEVKQ